MSTGVPFRTVAAVIAIILLICAGGGAVRLLATTQPGGATVVLVGGSPSARSSDPVIEACARAAGARAVAAGADLTIAPIGGSPVDLRTRPIHTRLSVGERLDPSRTARAHATAAGEVRERLHELEVHRVPQGSSDTLTAIAIVADGLVHATAPRRLVVCDDAHEVGSFPFGPVNFYRERLTPSRVRQLLLELRPFLPDLSGVDVAFGATDTDQLVHLDQAREAAIAAFWSAWARTTRAHRFSYDTALASGDG